MSIHAQLSPEALAKLHAQQRNSTITSIIIAILTVLLIGIILLFLLLPRVENFTPEIVSYQAGSEDKEEVTKPEMTRNIQHKPSAPSPNLAKVIAANTASATAIPLPDMEVPDPSSDFGVEEDFSDVWVDANDGESGFGGIPSTMQKRCSKQDRLNRLSKNGGNEKCEEAVVKSLRWLKQTQNADGSWTNKRKVSMTGFALLAFLGHCETPNSEEFGDAVTRAIIYLVNISMKQGGKLADDIKDKHWPYEHAIATYALGEAATFCIKLGINIPNLKEATKASGDWIIKHQHRSGSWDYHYDRSGNRGGDNSIGMWHIQALKACKHTGLWKDRDFKHVMHKALSYIKKTQNDNGGIGYTSTNDNGGTGFTMTGGGMLAYQMWGKSHDVVVRKASKFLRSNTRFRYNSRDCDLYRQYYNVQAMINRGGEEWEQYNRLFRDEILKNQNADGTYKNVGGGNKKINAVAPDFKGTSKVAVHYRTCLATFMLEAYYRFLPATGSKVH